MKISCKRAAVAASWWLVAVALSNAAPAEEQTQPKEGQEAQSQEQVAILKQINRVNDDGSYTFGYEAADGSFKIETRDVLGNVKGMFGFIDETGELKRVSYSASNNTGFQSTGTLAPTSEGEAKQAIPTRTPASTPPLLYQQIIRPLQAAPGDAQVTTRRPIFRSPVLTTTTGRPVESTTRRPVLLYAQQGVTEAPEPVTRSAVIQSIPRVRRPTEVPSSTERPQGTTTTRRPVLYGQYIRQQPGLPGGQPVKQIFVTPAPVDETTSPQPTGVVYGHYIRATQPTDRTTPPGPLLRRVVLARRPSDVTPSTEAPTRVPVTLHAKQTQESKDDTDGNRHVAKGNNLRRQLSPDRSINLAPGVQLPPQVLRPRQTGTDDAGDVYGGSIGGSPRPIPATPFRGLFAPMQPRAVQNALLQSQLLQGIAGIRQRPGYPQDELDPRIPPGAIPSAVGGSVRIPVGVIRGGVLDPRVPPGAYQYSPPGYQYPLQGPDPDLQDQLLQVLLGRQQTQSRQPPYVNDYNYRQRNQVPSLTPFQLALMMTLGENIPPELLDDPYQQQVNRQQPVYNPQQVPYSRQNIPYPVPYNPQQVPYNQQQVPYNQQQVPYNQQQVPYPQVPYNQQQIPYNQPLPYDPQQQQIYPPQYQQPYPGNYQGPIAFPSQIPYHLRRRLRYRPQPAYGQPLPYGNGQPVPPDYYQQPLPYAGRNPPIGYPQDYLPDEYRDALILRMLLAVRAAQQQGRGQHRPIEHNPNIQERSQPFFAHDSTTTSTTTVRPRTLAPVRNVQILDPVTEESTAKRSTNTPTRS
ncbi:uncharacterized protein [Periplaneta americana]|uniref:uncharacterized protein n=1 Tax=Periplaneta americana TaxID=6978 RepID=UPI0037E99BDB